MPRVFNFYVHCMSLQNLAAKSIARNIHANELANLVKALPFNMTRRIIRQTPASGLAREAVRVASARRRERLDNIVRRLVRARLAIMKHIEGRVPGRGRRRGKTGRLSNQLWNNKQEAIARARMTPRQRASRAWWAFGQDPTKWKGFVYWHVRSGGRSDITRNQARAMYA
jgi:hypothetical protein